MPRALLISPSGVPGGAERALTGLARHLPDQGWQVRAVMLQPGPLRDWLEGVGCPVEVIEAGRTRQLPRTGAVVARLAHLARSADVVISNQSKGHVYGGMAARIAHRPAVWWQHGTPTRSAIESVARLIPSAMVVAGSKDSLAAQSRLTPHRRVELVHPGVDVAGIRARRGTGLALREAHGWGEATLVGIVGRLQEWKGQDVFLRAASQVAVAHPEVEFVVVGGAVLGWEGDYPRRLESLAGTLGIAERVHFVGHQEDVYPWFDALDVVVHASFGESFGLVPVEAMASGRPLVATAAGGPVEIVEHGESGLLVPPGDHEALAAAVTRILDDPALRQRLASGATARAEEFDERRMAQRFGSLLTAATGLPASSDVPSGPLAEPSGRGQDPLVERTVPGLHSYVFTRLVVAMKPTKAVDLGAGTGAFAARLGQAGFDVLAVDRDRASFAGTADFQEADFDERGWEFSLGVGQWPLVTAIEVIEHLEAPISFLRAIRSLLTADGTAIVTTPNVDSLPARGKFLLHGTLRMLDKYGDPTHVSPIFWDLLVRQYLPRAGLELVSALTYPEGGFVAGRPLYRRAMRLAAPLVRAKGQLLGDNHVLVLRRR